MNQHMVRPSGLEPPTPTMSRWCSNQLSYGRTALLLKFGASEWTRTTDPTMSRWCSNQLSYGRTVLLQEFGASEWTRTTDPHHVKVVL